MMGAVRMLTAAQLRRRWRGLIGITLVLAFAGGVVLTALAGARRTSSATQRFRDQTRTADATVNIFPVSRKFAAEIGALPGVESYGQISPWATIVAGTHHYTSLVPAVDRRFGRTVDRSILIAGRQAHGPHEIVASESFAAVEKLHVGSRFRFRAFTKEQGAQLRNNSLTDPTPRGPLISLRVVGIDHRSADFSPAASQTGLAFASHEVFRAYHDLVGDFGGLVRVRLRPGASAQEFVQHVRTIAHGRFIDFDTSSDEQSIQDSLRVLAIGLTLFGAISAVAALAAIVALLARSDASTLSDQPIWNALGLGTADRIAVGFLPLVPVAFVGAIGAGIVAVLGSQFMPIGLARRIEPDPGISVDPLVLGIGVGAVGLLALVGALLIAWRSARRRAWDPALHPRQLHLSRAARVASAIGAPPAVVVGVRMALERGRGRTAVPVRPALVGSVAGILGIVAALILGANIDRLVTQPVRYGWTFDAVVIGDGGQSGRGGPCGPQHSRLERDPRITSLGSVCATTLVVGRGKPIAAFGYRTIRGDIRPPILRGRAPRTDREIALGEKTLTNVGASIGDEIRVSGNHGRVQARIVGTAVFPSFEDPTPLAEGAVMTPRTLSRIATDNSSSYNHLIVRWGSAVDVAAGNRSLASISGQRANPPTPPLEIHRLEQVNALPWILAGFLAFLALVAIAQAVLANARRRRPEFALLETMGFRRRQLRRTVNAQALTLALVGLGFGIPLGVVTGRWAWGLIARDVGVATDAATPIWLVLALVPIALVAVLAIALYPARSVTRERPSVALRSE